MARKRDRQAPMELCYIDAARLRLHMQQSGLNQSRLCTMSRLSRHTVKRMLEGRGVYPSTAKVLAKVLSVDVLSLLATNNVPTEANSMRLADHPEWNVVEGSVAPLIHTNSNLFVRSCKLKHKLLPDEFGRGKLYDLMGVPDLVKEQMIDQLTRHAVVCRSLRTVPQIVDNLSVTAVDSGNAWWIVDQWVTAKRLSDLLLKGLEWEIETLQNVMIQVLTALAEMHKRKIVFRELAPQRILITPQLEVLITDLELAKLLELGGTVSSKWDQDEYRAPEVEEGDSRPQADFYSWARVFTHVLIGELPKLKQDTMSILETSALPANYVEIIDACLSPDWKKRPASAQQIISKLR